MNPSKTQSRALAVLTGKTCWGGMRAGYILSVRKESTANRQNLLFPAITVRLRHRRHSLDLVSFDFYCVLFAGTGLAESSQLYGEKFDATYAHAVQTTACSALAALSASCFSRRLPLRDTYRCEMGC